MTNCEDGEAEADELGVVDWVVDWVVDGIESLTAA